MTRIAALAALTLLVVAPFAAGQAGCEGCNGTKTLECLACGGEGTVPAKCRQCDGAGKFECKACGPRFRAEIAGRIICRFCRGVKSPKKSCAPCRGRGWSRCPSCNSGTARCVCGGEPRRVACADCCGQGKLPCALCTDPGPACLLCGGEKKLGCGACRGEESIYPCASCNDLGFESCRDCSSTGSRPCKTCNATGKTRRTERKGSRQKVIESRCRTCKGKRAVDCASCKSGKKECQACRERKRPGCAACNDAAIDCAGCDPCPARCFVILSRALVDREEYVRAVAFLEAARASALRAVAVLEGTAKPEHDWERELFEHQEKLKGDRKKRSIARHRGVATAIERELKDVGEWAPPKPEEPASSEVEEAEKEEGRTPDE